MNVAISPQRSTSLSAEPALALPRYQLVSRLATGGMAEVFLAILPTDLGAAKTVVIKRLWPELARDPECVQMFLAEARLSLRLSHPNVIHAYEFGYDGERHFLAMEYLDGQSLKHILDRFPGRSLPSTLSLPLTLKIISDILAGLEYVHGLAELDGTPLQIVHRDVSPQNVFVTCDGTVKLIDFGIAQTSLAADHKPREIKGRLAYMAPEQAAGGSVDHRADLFSVGVMLWEMAVGRRLWQGQSDTEIQGRLLAGEALPYLPKSQGFPPGLASICNRALSVHPGDRYQTAVEFQADLADLITGSMPVQSRLLGDMVSRGFASSRALARSMIQQSLPASSKRRPSSSQDLTALEVAPTAQESVGAQPSRHSSTHTIAATHDDITQVSPPPMEALRPLGLPRWFVLAASIEVLALAGWLALWLKASPPVEAPLIVVDQPAMVLSAEPAPSYASVSTPSPPVRLAASGMAKIIAPSHRTPRSLALARAPHRSSTTVTGSASESVRPQDFFEVARVRGLQPLPHSALPHAIDREDPYAR